MSLPLIDNLNLIKDKLFSFDEIVIENFVFNLNRFFTVTILVTFSILLSLSQVSILVNFSILLSLSQVSIVVP